MAPPQFGAGGGVTDGYLAQATITPAGFGALASKFGVHFFLDRVAETKSWQKQNGNGWQVATGDQNINDPSLPGNEDLRGGSDHLYDADAPGWNAGNNTLGLDAWALRFNGWEFVNIQIANGSYVRCSQDLTFHCTVTLKAAAGGAWARDNAGNNDVAAGLIQVDTGNTP